MGDIGLLGTKVKSESGEGYHITVGGGLEQSQAGTAGVQRSGV